MGSSCSARSRSGDGATEDSMDNMVELKKKHEDEIRQLKERIMEEQRKNNSIQQSATTTAETGGIHAGGVTEHAARSEGPLRQVLAMHSHEASESAELTFAKGTKFEVLNDSDPDWLYVRDMAKQQTGYVSGSLVSDATSLEAQDWYFGDTKRIEAERMLTSNTNLPPGGFLIRNSETSFTKFHMYTLSVKMIVSGYPNDATNQYNNGETGSRDVIVAKHHKIQVNSNGWFFIRKSVTFKTLHHLVVYYHGPGTGPNGSQLSLLTAVLPKPRPTFYDLSRSTRSQWEIPRSALQLHEEIADGNFGVVWKGTYNHTREVAIKKLKPGRGTVEEFRQEAKIMKGMRHPHILALYAVCTEDVNSFLIVTEYMNRGSLKKLLETDGDKLSLPELLEICTQVASGMAYLEKERFVHRDLAARNVLVDSNKYCKVADFGLTRDVNNAEDNGLYRMKTEVPLPVRWMAPESLREKIFSSKSDVWAFGILIMEVLTHGGLPYPDLLDNNEVERRVVQFGHRMKRPTKPVNCPEWLYNEIILKCWMEEPEQRLSFWFLEEQLSQQVSTCIEYIEDSEM